MQPMRTAPLLAVALVLAASCASVTLDLTDIAEPVMLSSVPADATYAVTHVDDFFTEVAHATGGVSGGAGGSRSSQIHENEAQVDTFEAIGGFDDRMILVDELEAWGGGGNLLIVYAEVTNVLLRGRIVARTDGAEGGSGDE